MTFSLEWRYSSQNQTFVCTTLNQRNNVYRIYKIVWSCQFKLNLNWTVTGEKKHIIIQLLFMVLHVSFIQFLYRTDKSTFFKLHSYGLRHHHISSIKIIFETSFIWLFSNTLITFPTTWWKSKNVGRQTLEFWLWPLS